MFSQIVARNSSVSPALIVIGVAGLVFGGIFWHEVARAVDVWIGSTAYNHCFLILPLIGFLLWERRAVIASVWIVIPSRTFAL